MNSFPSFTPPSRPILPILTFNQTNTDKTPSKPQLNLPFTPRTPQTDATSLSSLSSPISTLSPLGLFGSLPNASNSLSMSQNQLVLENLLSPNREVVNFLVNWKLQQALQTEVFNAQMQQLMDIRSSLVEKLKKQNSQEETQTQTAHSTEIPQQKENAKVETPQRLETKNVTPSRDLKRSSTGSQSKNLKFLIQQMVEFILENFGRVSEKELEDEKMKYSSNPSLVEVFDLLVCKYGSTVKTKEEMVKYVLRRALKFIRSDLKKKTNTNAKNVSKTMLQYFNVSDASSKLASEDELLKEILPFRKNSKNKTMNTTFINDMFSSENFKSDYQNYLQNFGNILEADNHNKMEKLVDFIEECLARRKINDVKNYKRIPWPKLWIINTKKVAQDLPNYNSQSPQTASLPQKRSRTESECSLTKKDRDSQN